MLRISDGAGAGRPAWRVRLVAGVLALCMARPAWAGSLVGVSMPDTLEVGGAHVVLNGMALRTYSFLRIRIYVAGLYLEHRSSDADAIMASSEAKLFRFNFVRDVSAEAARRSWRQSLGANCTDPCRLPDGAEDKFLAKVPAVHAGDISAFLFQPSGLTISLNGQALGTVTDAGFAHVIMASFIGEHPTAPDVKRALLGLGG